MSIDKRSGFCSSSAIFYSKRPPIQLPQNQSLDVTTFISSRPHNRTTAFIDATTGRHLTFAQLWRAVDAISSALSTMGIRKGHVVLILSPNSIHFPIICLSVLSLGAIITTTNPSNTKSEIAKQIADSKPVLAFTIPGLLPKLTGSEFPIVLIDDGDHGVGDRCDSGLHILTTLEKLMNNKPSQTRVKDHVTQDDAATFLYSSGTTGYSKGVVSSHRNLIAMIQTMIYRYGDSHHKFICTVPMFHIYGLALFAIGLLATGSTVVILSKFDIYDLFLAVSNYKVSYCPLVPPILVAMVNKAEEIKRRYDLGSLKYVICGGAPLAKEVIDRFVENFPGVTILQGYGLTETTVIGTSTDNAEESMRYGTAGLLSPSMEAKVVEIESGGAEVGVGKRGEIWLRGPVVMKGYLNNPEETATALDSNGWLRTGDIGYFDEDGFLFIVDRLKELIKYKALQVAPAELEAVLLTHPEIEDAAVIPFPDKEVGQFPMAYVVRKAGSNLSENQIMDFVAKQVAPYKKIRRVAFISSIPKNPSGKILRKDLVKLATSSSRL